MLFSWPSIKHLLANSINCLLKRRDNNGCFSLRKHVEFNVFFYRCQNGAYIIMFIKGWHFENNSIIVEISDFLPLFQNNYLELCSLQNDFQSHYRSFRFCKLRKIFSKDVYIQLLNYFTWSCVTAFKDVARYTMVVFHENKICRQNQN